ncbi:uncharacterized protein LOC101858041 [Aplysia californica]|uniref:Uncharacterized protein LOC101858041 n=1 Tax=Aplysia californica TaxID=6500 RepID=A0ABM0JU09_APLCA|nr:uncharacterized protein LOC101858041 [Aplysia californica]
MASRGRTYSKQAGGQTSKQSLFDKLMERDHKRSNFETDSVANKNPKKTKKRIPKKQQKAGGGVKNQSNDTSDGSSVQLFLDVSWKQKKQTRSRAKPSTGDGHSKTRGNNVPRPQKRESYSTVDEDGKSDEATSSTSSLGLMIEGEVANVNKNRGKAEAGVAETEGKRARLSSPLLLPVSGFSRSGNAECKDVSKTDSLEIPRREAGCVSRDWAVLSASDLVTLAASDGDSAMRKRTESLGSTEKETSWVTASSSQMNWSNSGEMWYKTGSSSSRYTYSDISAYTFGTESSAPSTAVSSSTPVVKPLQTRRFCNSTTVEGRESIGRVQFPPFLSPVLPDGGAENDGQNLMDEDNCQPINENKSRPMDEDKGQSRKDITAGIELCPQVPHRRPAKMKESTPKDTFLPVSFSLSPIPLVDLDESVLGCRESREVNSEEIIVPALREITVLSGHSDNDGQGTGDRAHGVGDGDQNEIDLHKSVESLKSMLFEEPMERLKKSLGGIEGTSGLCRVSVPRKRSSTRTSAAAHQPSVAQSSPLPAGHTSSPLLAQKSGGVEETSGCRRRSSVPEKVTAGPSSVVESSVATPPPAVNTSPPLAEKKSSEEELEASDCCCPSLAPEKLPEGPLSGVVGSGVVTAPPAHVDGSSPPAQKWMEQTTPTVKAACRKSLPRVCFINELCRKNVAEKRTGRSWIRLRFL